MRHRTWLILLLLIGTVLPVASNVAAQEIEWITGTTAGVLYQCSGSESLRSEGFGGGYPWSAYNDEWTPGLKIVQEKWRKPLRVMPFTEQALVFVDSSGAMSITGRIGTIFFGDKEHFAKDTAFVGLQPFEFPFTPKQIAYTQSGVVFVTEDGRVFTTGMYDSGILGVRTHEQLYTDPLYKWSFIVGPPIHVPIDAFIVSVAVGGSSCIALDSTGRVWEWGTGIAERPGSIDPRFDTTTLTPRRRESPRDIVAIFGSAHFGFAIDEGERLWVWGSNPHGALGLGHTNHVDEPQVVSNVTGIRSITTNSLATLALMENGELWGWGKAYSNRTNNFGEGKVGSNAPVELPRRLAHFAPLRSLRFDNDTFLAIDEQNTTYVWGNAGGFQQVLSKRHPYDTLPTPRIVPGICDGVSRVEMAKQPNAVLVHPQPAADVVECVLPSEVVDVVQVYVVGITGQRHPMDYTSEGKYLRVRTSALAPGMYALAVLTGKDVLYVQLVKR